MLDGVRDSVLRDIGRIENRARWFQWVVPGWNLRFAFVTSLALLLFGVLFSLAINRRQPPRHDPKSNQVELSPGKAPDDRANYDGQTERSKTVRSKFGRKPIKPGLNESPQTDERMIEPDLITQDMNTDASASDQSAAANTEDADMDASRDMLRIEIQTADPNIRIIWFAPKSEAAPTPTP
jgi:hypothetical protein